MFYVTYSYYDDYRVVAKFTSYEAAKEYAQVNNIIASGFLYDVEDFADVPLNPEVEAVIVLREGTPYRHFRDLETAEKWISKRKIPAMYTLRPTHTSHKD
jgi:hypothetical protein